MALYSDGCNLRRCWVCTLTDCLKFRFKLALFYEEKKNVGKGFGIQGKVNQINQAAFFHLCPGRWTSPPGAQGLRFRLDGLQSSWGTKVELLLVSWSQGGSYLQVLKQ